MARPPFWFGRPSKCYPGAYPVDSDSPSKPQEQGDQSMRTTTMILAAATVGVFALASPALAKAKPKSESEAGVKVGTLSCNVESGWGFVFGSSKDLHCTYTPDKGKPARYTGAINKFGVDIGYSEGGVMVWVVVAPTSDVGPDALEGE